MNEKMLLYIADGDHVLGETYYELLASEPDMEVVGNSDGQGVEGIGAAIAIFKPNVVLFGTERPGARVIGDFHFIRDRHPEVGFVLLSSFYTTEGAKQLREFIRSTSGACACLSKHTSNNVGRLVRMIHAVSQGRMVVDTVTMEALIETGIGDWAPGRSRPIPRLGC